MKKIFIIILSLLFVGSIYSQQETTKTDKLRDKAYHSLKHGKIKKAKRLYKKLLKSETFKNEDVVNYALLLSQLKEYEEAKIWFTKFNKLEPTDSRGIDYLNNSGDIIEFLIDKGFYSIKNLDINTPYEDFSAVFYKDNVLFTSSRIKAKPIKRLWKDNKLPFLDVFEAQKKENYDLHKVVNFDKKLNKNYHDGPVSFNSDESIMYITTDNYTGQSSDGIIKLKLFKKVLNNGEWSEKIAFPYNSEEYSVGHGTLTKDDQWLFFSSSIEGGFGGVDIFKARVFEDGTYGPPINLGSKINTEGNEMFPVINDNLLYFSSNGKVGLGGLDIFAIKLNGGDIVGDITNIGAPINSSRDDFSFVLADDGQGGYFSSNRTGGHGSDDIYSFKNLKDRNFGKILTGITKDIKYNVIPNAMVSLFDDEGNLISTVESNINGKYYFTVENKKHYLLEGDKIDYTKGKNSASTYTKTDTVYADLILEKGSNIWLDITVVDAETQNPLSNVTIDYEDLVKNGFSMFNTDANGNYIDKLRGVSIKDHAKFNLKLTKNGYLAKTIAYEFDYNKPGAYYIKEALVKTNVGSDLGKDLAINPIYYNLDKSFIRPDAEIELKKIVRILNENPNMVLELRSHTDCRSSRAYNRKLSQRRASSAANYIKSRIPNPKNISGKGYGESQLSNNCSCEGSQKNPCNESQHQQNRRTEFIIIKM